MKTQHYLVLGSLVFAGLAAVGCADISDDDVSTETGASEDELKAQAQKFVGDYQWDPSSTFTDFEKLSLEADGSYKANVEASLVKKVVCVAFPCTQPEAGKWTTTKANGTLKITFTPNDKKPTRSYLPSLSNGALSLTRYNKTTKLVLAKQGTPCLLMLCAQGTKCVDGPQGGKCVASASCATTLCAPGTICKESPNGPQCVANNPCGVTGCSSEICADRPMFSPCIYKPEFACYAKTTCERQADGQCGWTKTPVLDACLANP